MKIFIEPLRRWLLIGIASSACSFAYASCPPPILTSFTFAQAATRLLQCNRDLLLAQTAIAAAQADVQTADRSPNPTLTIGSAYINPQIGIGAGPLYQKQVDWQARIDHPAERGNKRGLRTAMAESALHATQWGVAEARRQQQLALATAWINLWSSQQRVKVLTALQDLYQRTQDAAQARLRVGDIAANDLVRISVDTQHAQNDVHQAKIELARAQFDLAALLAMEAQASALIATDAWQTLASPSAPEKLELLTAGRPDVQAARAQLDTAKAARDLALSQRTRDLTFGVQLEHYPAPAGIGNSISVAVSMPLFVRHYNDGEIARAEADFTTALLALRKVEQLAFADQHRLAVELQAAAARAERLKFQLLPLVEKMAANAEFAYKKGSVGVFDLLDALKQLRQMQLDAVAAQADYEKADAAVRAAVLNVAAADESPFSSSFFINSGN